MRRLSSQKSIVSMLLAACAAPVAAQPRLPAPPAQVPSDSSPAALTADSIRRAVPEAVAGGGDELTAYYAVPEIPANTILGVTPATITRPSSPKDFIASLIDGIGADGRVRQGVAIEASLGLLRPFRVSLAEYQGSARARFWSNMLVSIATARVGGDTTATDLAWGVRAPIIDHGDLLARSEYTTQLGVALLACALAKVPNAVPRNTGLQLTEAELAEQERTRTAMNDASRAAAVACLERAASAVGKKASAELWNAPRLTIAYAGSTRFPSSAFSDGRRLADQLWAVGAIPLSRVAGPLPFARSTQAIAFLNWGRQRVVDTLPMQRTLKYGARLNVGSATLNGFYELLGEHRRNPPAGVDENGSSWSLGIEFLAAQDVWISTGVGRRAAQALQPDKTLLLANIRWGISRKPFLSPQPTAPAGP